MRWASQPVFYLLGAFAYTLMQRVIVCTCGVTFPFSVKTIWRYGHLHLGQTHLKARCKFSREECLSSRERQARAEKPLARGRAAQQDTAILRQGPSLISAISLSLRTCVSGKTTWYHFLLGDTIIWKCYYLKVILLSNNLKESCLQSHQVEETTWIDSNGREIKFQVKPSVCSLKLRHI